MTPVCRVGRGLQGWGGVGRRWGALSFCHYLSRVFEPMDMVVEGLVIPHEAQGTGPSRGDSPDYSGGRANNAGELFLPAL